jgi:hypothetical protein
LRTEAAHTKKLQRALEEKQAALDGLQTALLREAFQP